MTRRSEGSAQHNGDAVAGVLLWRRIADDIEQWIARGEFRPGTRLPGEVDIAERFGVNRHTIRRAIAALAQRGLLRAERGSGTYIEAQRLAYPIRRHTRFTDIVHGTGRAAGGRLVGTRNENADASVALWLKLKPGTPVVRLEQLRSADGVPICAATTWLPATRFPDAGRVYNAARSVTRMLAHFGVRDFVRKQTQVTAAIADAIDADSLKLSPGRALLVVESVDADADDVPILTSRARFAADRVSLTIDTG
jgi:GntR family transcriptional regulator, phosphonate transport system regulatory protein